MMQVSDCIRRFLTVQWNFAADVYTWVYVSCCILGTSEHRKSLMLEGSLSVMTP